MHVYKNVAEVHAHYIFDYVVQPGIAEAHAHYILTTWLREDGHANFGEL